MGELAYKICIFGESRVGKTTLAQRFLKGYFDEDIKLTMGAEIFVKFLTVEDKRIVLQVWDFGGEKEFHFLLPLYSRGSSGGIYMFDLTRIGTLTRADEWLNTFKKGLSAEKRDIPILLVGSKLDLKDQLYDSREEAEQVIKQYNLFKYIECSSKTGENVDLIFKTLIKRILEDFNII